MSRGRVLWPSIAVIGVHYADGGCEALRCPRMKLLPQSLAFRGDLRQEVQEVAIGRIDACRLDRIRRLWVHFWPIFL